MRSDILAYLRNVKIDTPAKIAAMVHCNPGAAQAELHVMDEDGLVRLHEGTGRYSLSAKGMAACLETPS